MKKVIRLLTVAAAAMLLAAMPSSVFATCSGINQFLQHSLGMFFTGCPDATPVAGYAYVLGTDTTNTVAATLACNDATQSTNQFIPCQPEAGIPGDGNVTIQYDWGGATNTPPGTACPNQSG